MHFLRGISANKFNVTKRFFFPFERFLRLYCNGKTMANLKRWKDVSVSNKTRKMFLNFQKKIFSQFLFLKSLFKVTENVEFAFAIISCYSSSYWIILNEKKYYYYLIRQMSSWENVDCPLFTILSDLAWLLPIHLLPPSPLFLIRPLFKVIFVSTIVRTVEKLSTKT